MRRFATTLAAVAVTAALATGACGGDDDDSSSDSSSSGGGSKREFCDGFKDALDIDPRDAQGEKAFAALKDLDPPDEIADDWQTFIDYIDTVAAGKTPSDNEANKWLDATQHLNTYAEDECGIKATAGG